ncbi:stage II sporulation protein D [Tissierella sp. MSJ-40]|uniref:Stage II sporulation protein D n=1 Tax=Tissierella simiarum TaxID=2841534 RepID=A0ABS6E386_9FIRM|nr:stage II sporulation protein D [Tissierella simiarum]MBU5436719.1 stage II sporulation protein D [Tissierella simiarum]
MKRFGMYLCVVLIITIFIPTVIVKTFNFVPVNTSIEGKKFRKEKETVLEEKTPIKLEDLNGKIKVFNSRTGEVEELLLDDYVKGVVAAEMPGEFHIEALKAQAIASRTYALSRSLKFKDGHPDHKGAPLCTGVHCQAYLSLDELREIHSDGWVEKYWGKIEKAVDSTKNQGIFYNGEIIEPLYHSTSGGMTEDVKDVFAVELPYLRSVASPYEEGAPKFKNVVTLTVDEFIKKILTKYSGANITKENFSEKIKLVEKTESGRIKKIAIDNNVVNGRELRDLFELNSTNFTISYNVKLGIVEIETFGYGHGVGMSQWGANGMAKNGKNYEEILKHYYTGVELREIE